MLHFDETFINEKKLEANQTKPNQNISLLLPLQSQKFDLLQLKKFWEALPPKEKENCLTIRTPKIIETFLNIVGKMLRQPNFKPIPSPNPLNNKKPLFWFLEFEDVANPYFSYDVVTNIMGCFMIISCNALNDLKNLPEGFALELTRDSIVDWGVFEKEGSFLLKIKAKYLDFFMAVMEHHSKCYLCGDKILLYEEKYDSFFTNMMNQPTGQQNHFMLIFERLIRTLCILFENNILRSFYKYDFSQNLQYFDQRSNTAFFYVIEQGYKPLKVRAVVTELKIQLNGIQPQTPKKKENLIKTTAKKLENPEDIDIMNALYHPKNSEHLEELKEEVEGSQNSTPNKKKKKLELKDKIKPPNDEFYNNSYAFISKASPNFTQSPPINIMTPEFLAFDLNGDNMGIFGKQSPANFNDQFTMNRSFPEKKL